MTTTARSSDDHGRRVASWLALEGRHHESGATPDADRATGTAPAPLLPALLSAAVSICGVSAAIAAAGAVTAKEEDLAYPASLLIGLVLASILFAHFSF